MNKIFHGLFEDQVFNVPDQLVDLIVTSPPYAQQRASTYGGIDEQFYPQWTVNWMRAAKRVLKPNGSVVINIRPNVQGGTISDYMLRTRLDLRNDHWYEIDEWIWVKPDAPPLGHVMRPRRTWESLHWFSLSNKPYCDPKATGRRSTKIGISSKKGIGAYIGANSNGHDEGIARSTDVLIAQVCENDRSEWNIHPAQYPVTLVEQVIQTLCPLKGVVLDPFMGSGTTAIAALMLDRSYIGFEKEQTYIDIIDRRIAEYHTSLPDSVSDEFFRTTGGDFFR